MDSCLTEGALKPLLQALACLHWLIRWHLLLAPVVPLYRCEAHYTVLLRRSHLE